ncbi:molybdenum cofactor guanylyltransferase [Microbacterium sp. P02]|uniref:molybdenum cofactor guanylyltransferase n=1 Tax=Microbacterium sp. P02 TaxID=3366260 RepID=UPI00366BAEFE
MDDHASLGAILLAGGRATRVDGAAKHLFDVGGRTLLERAVAAAASAGAQPIVVVGPRPADLRLSHVRWVREDPPFRGPAAGIVAALAVTALSTAARTDPEWTLVLACDLPDVQSAVTRLMRDIPLLPSDTEGVCLADATSRPQWLIGAYRTSALRRAATALADGGRDASVRALLAGLAIAVVTAPATETADIDTWQDLEDARRRYAAAEESPLPLDSIHPAPKESP